MKTRRESCPHSLIAICLQQAIKGEVLFRDVARTTGTRKGIQTTFNNHLATGTLSREKEKVKSLLTAGTYSAFIYA